MFELPPRRSGVRARLRKAAMACGPVAQSWTTVNRAREFAREVLCPAPSWPTPIPIRRKPSWR